MKYIIFGALQFVLWAGFQSMMGILKDERAVVAVFAVSAVATIVMLAIIIREKK